MLAKSGFSFTLLLFFDYLIILHLLSIYVIYLFNIFLFNLNISLIDKEDIRVMKNVTGLTKGCVRGTIERYCIILSLPLIRKQ